MAEDFAIAAARKFKQAAGIEDPSQVVIGDKGAWVHGTIWVPLELAEEEAQHLLERG